MKPFTLPEPSVKRKRIPLNNTSEDVNGNIAYPKNVHAYYSRREIEMLEGKIEKLVSQAEAYHLLVQKHYSDKVKLQNKIGGVMRHISETLAHEKIPGGRQKKVQNLDPVVLANENRLLQWKLSVIDKFFKNSFPEIEIDDELSCSGTPLRGAKGDADQ